MESHLKYFTVMFIYCCSVLTCLPDLYAQTLLVAKTVEDFEAPNTSGFRVYTQRSCQLQLTSTYFVISGKQAAELDVTNSNIDPEHPPGFYVYPALSDWSGFSSLVIRMVALPYDLSSEVRVTVQLNSMSKPGTSRREETRSYEFSVPANSPVTAVLPINDLAFKERIGSIFFGVLNSSGQYFMDDIQVAQETPKETAVRSLMLPPGIRLPFNISFGLRQKGSFYYDGILYYDSNALIDVQLTSNVPPETSITIPVDCTGTAGENLLATQVALNQGDSLKILQIHPDGDGNLSLKVGNLSRTVALRQISDLNSMRRQNALNVSKLLQNKSIFPSGKRLVAATAGMKYDESGRPDLKEMISRLTDLGVNCFAYQIDHHPRQELDSLPEFCDLAAKAGIEVWAYLDPPTEAPTFPNEPNGSQLYPPFGLDYVRWAKEIGAISKSHPNLTLWMIDDFDHNLNFFTPAYTKDIFAALKQENHGLAFGVVVYHENLKKFNVAAYSPYVEAVLWGYQDNAQLDSTYGISATTLPIDINDFWNAFPKALVIPCIYFTPHSSWSGRKATPSYLLDALTTATQDAGIAFVFNTPFPGTSNYSIVKKFCHSSSLK
ncbi:MAG TPA: hypothetical protein VLX91_04700 [Candidatus Acidoferrales bacterium]|nr:hypothetical protein [Candidatus Acidoferrales bacterium]